VRASALSVELTRLRDELAAEKKRADAAEAASAWVVGRITDELRQEGIELQWTDGGGSACPGGWHRNPFLNLGRLSALRARGEALAAEVSCREAHRAQGPLDYGCLVETPLDLCSACAALAAWRAP